MNIGDKIYCLEKFKNKFSIKGVHEYTIVTVGKKYYTVRRDNEEIKVEKSSLTHHNGYKKVEFYPSREKTAQVVWLTKNLHSLAEAIREVNDIGVLKKIAELIGYKEQY